MPPAKETDGIEITGFILPSTVRLTAKAESSMMVGREFATGMTVNGIVSRMVALPNGAIRVHIETGELLLVYPSGMVCEVKA